MGKICLGYEKMGFLLFIFLSTFLVLLCLPTVIHGEDNSGVLNIDCGTTEDYTDSVTHTYYTSDAQFTLTGAHRNISDKHRSGNSDPRLSNLRCFPKGKRNCYTLSPKQGKHKNYLIRAWFLYGNYDGRDNYPAFDLYVGTTWWDTVSVSNASVYVLKEIMYVSSTDYIHICLVNTGFGTPFISALDLRYVNDSIYKSRSGCMTPYVRNDMGSNLDPFVPFKYDNDELDRLWYSYSSIDTKAIGTDNPVDSLGGNEYGLPMQIMWDAVKPLNTCYPISYVLDEGGTATKFYIFLHFCEVEKLQGKELREFDIFVNDVLWVKSVVPTYLKSTTVTKEDPVRGGVSGAITITLVRTKRSTHPPIINALEIFLEREPQDPSTDADDVDAMVDISLRYRVKKNWQGDPCSPVELTWSGLNCSGSDNSLPQIISLNLSSSGLTGVIAPSIVNLKSVQYLDLSNNSLTGLIPEFLAQLPLKVLNLTGNNLTGPVPKSLVEKSSLSFSTGGNPNLCWKNCKPSSKKDGRKVTLAIAIYVTSAIACLGAIATFWSLMRRKTANKEGRTLRVKNRRFSYSEVLRITDNFKRVIGRGGYGIVYFGLLEDGTEVAVKMLSQQSAKGSEQFWTEAELLTTIHHRNLASLVGYSDQGSNTALIYEYMANGDLREYLSDRKKVVLSWEQRLQISIDAAQALEYLHSGCKPPIIHRDIKTANILLNENLQAKVADFGLSRIFPVEDKTHVFTAVMGTMGYLDPEYYITGRLTEKSDVYSFGVVLLELITGKPAIIKADENITLVHWVMPILERGDISEIVDQRLGGDYDDNSVWKALETAIACLPSSAMKRPAMSYVLGELKDCLEMELGSERSQYKIEIDKILTSINGMHDVETLGVESSVSCPQAR